MEALAAGVGVAQIFVQVCGLILKIEQAVDTARQNKEEWMELVDRLSVVRYTLPTLPHDQELARPLYQLHSTLLKAHKLVLECQDQGFIKQHLRAHRYAERFSKVNASITADLTLFPLAFYTADARRRDRMMPSFPPAQHDSGKFSAASIPSSSGSVAVQTPTVVSHGQTRRLLTWAEIAAATNNLANVLGKGRSGTVYRGQLHRGGGVWEDVAVKVLEHGRQGKEASFITENEILFHLRHEHIVRLVGSCAAAERRMIVYEYMRNGSLRDHLSGARGRSPVASSWKGRIKVLLGAARALLHLHRHPRRPVIHRNVSSSNILLDASWTSRLSDFGQALLKAAGEEGQLVQEAVGAFGYLDPEYYSTSRVSPASDVYSFGVVTLEVLTGRPHVSRSEGRLRAVTLVSSMLPVIESGRLRDVLDGRPALVPTTRQLEALSIVAHTAKRCLSPQGKDRLAMSNVVDNLERALTIVRSDQG